VAKCTSGKSEHCSGKKKDFFLKKIENFFLMA
jgi:hypothetical protein